jgi:hypothetical protein
MSVASLSSAALGAVARPLGTELDDIAAHCVDLIDDAEAHKACAECASVALGQQRLQPRTIGRRDQVHRAADRPRPQERRSGHGATSKSRHA